MREISDPVDADTSRRVDARLDDLYQRHLDLDEREVTQYYRLGDGYYRPDRADGEQEVFGICLVGTDGEVHGAGDYEVPPAAPLDRQDVLSVMLTCGMYGFGGEWAYSVALPAKSGVSGGILAVVPGKMGTGVFSPGLDPYRNSVRATRLCEEISERLGLHVFASEAEDSLLGRGRPRSAPGERTDPG